MRNAFVIEGPVPPELFFDRGEVVTFFRNLLELEKYKMLIAILGPFKFGKTSILFKLRSIASSYNKVIPLLLRLNIVSKPFTFIVKKLAEKIEGIDVEEVLRCEEPYYMFEKINIMLEKEDKWLLLLIDEFQDLPEAIKSEGFFINRQDKFIFEFVRGIVEEFRIGLGVSGSVIGPLMDALDVWHGRFIQFKLREFPREDSISMLRKLFDLSGMHADDSVLEYIAVSMNDHPFHMQLFGYYLVDQRNINDDTLEIARRKVQKILIDYYGRKLLEVKSIDPKAVRTLVGMLNPISVAELSDDEMDLVLKLERLGYVFRDNNEYRIYDKMFGKYITNVLSDRPKEKDIPEYTSEYIVAKKLAYEENFRDIFISLMSWGPFDIVILRSLGKLRGIGIQVKRTYGDKLIVDRKEMEKIQAMAEEANLLPVIAIVKLPRKDVEYLALDTEKRYSKLSELLEPLIGKAEIDEKDT